MPEATAEQIGTYISREVDLSSEISRVLPHKRGTGLPRAGLPNYGDRTTYNFLVGLARTVRGDDPGYTDWFAAIPVTYNDFVKTTAGKHFLGEVSRETVNDDPEGKTIFTALSRATLDLVGMSPTGVRLAVTEEAQSGKPVAFLRVDEVGTVRDALNRTDNPYDMQRLVTVLQDPADRYWQALAERGIAVPELDILNQVREGMADKQIVKVGMIYTNRKHRGRGLASQLAQPVFRNAIVPAMTNQAAEVMMQKGLPEHKTVLAPALTLDATVPMSERALFLALQIPQISTYENQLRVYKETSNPNAVDFSQFEDIRNVVEGVFRLGSQKMPFNADEQATILEDGIRRGRISPEEARLLQIPGIEKMQYTIISVPI